MLPDNLNKLLASNPAFSTVHSEDCLRRLASLFSLQEIPPRELLIKEGDPGDALFLVLEGSLGFTKQDPVSFSNIYLGSVGVGQITGEIGLVTGHPRSATVFAESDSVVARLSRVDFDLVCHEFPEELTGVVTWMQGQLHAYQIKTVIKESSLLKNLSAEIKLKLELGFQWTELSSGEVLFREGDLGDSLYLILSGRIRLSRRQDGADDPAFEPGPPVSEKFLAELGKGETFGEMVLLTDEPRSATAIAIRDSQLACLHRNDFDRILAAHPKELLSMFSSQLSARLRAKNSGKNSPTASPVSIAVLLASPLARGLASQLADQLSGFGTTTHLNHAQIKKLFPDRPVSADAAEARLLSWLNDQETRFEHIVYEADLAEEPWTIRSLRQADALFVVIDEKTNLQEVGTRLTLLLRRAGCRIEPDLIIYHSAASLRPVGTRSWLDVVRAKRHWHIRADVPDDISRIVRFLKGRSVGLVLGGGFAFGLAHIGVIEALRELEVPIDFTGGTSMGAVIAMACAMHYSREQMLNILQKGCASSLKGDLTFPIVSLLSGRKVARSIHSYLGDVDIEDLWLPYFAISASLIHARMVVHTTGNALRTVLASCRAPIMFPPLGWNDDVLIDGGLVNNVPCEVMRAQIGSGTVIAVDVSPEQGFPAKNQFDLQLSGWSVARQRANLFSRHPKPATIADIISRMVRLGGVAHLRQIRSSADLYLEPPLQQFTYRDFSKTKEISQVGYTHAMDQMQSWIDRHGRTWQGSAKNTELVTPRLSYESV